MQTTEIARRTEEGASSAASPQDALRRSESHLSTGRSGSYLFRRSWLPRRPVRIVALVHGFAEHSARYEHVGTRLAERACAVHALDLPGHGQTPGARGHIESFEGLLDDLGVFLERVRSEHPGLPLHLVGHSMGGLAVTALARERDLELASLVTSGAALSVQVSPVRRLLARALSRIAPRMSLPAGLDATGLSRDPEVVRAYLEDPLVFRKASAALGAGMLAAAERCAAGGQIRVPMMLMHGGRDPICDPEASRRFHASLGPDAELKVYPELRHEIFNEPEWEEVIEDLLAWLEKRDSEQSVAGG